MSRTRRLATTLLLPAAAAIAIAGCGGGDADRASSDGGAAATATQRGNAVDRAFVAQMIPHHQMAVEMAGMALDRGERPEINELSREIVTTQRSEIADLRSAAGRLGVQPAGMAMGPGMMKDAETLGLSMDEMGMSMDMAGLGAARPFDRAYIDDMIPHHQGAIRMARAQLERGSDPALETLAEEIISAQKGEITRMNGWREDWYGAASPAGGVPAR